MLINLQCVVLMLHCSGRGSENGSPERRAQLQLSFAMHEWTLTKSSVNNLGEVLAVKPMSGLKSWASCGHDNIIGSRWFKSEHVRTMVEHSEDGCPECQGKNGSLPHLRAVTEFILSGRDISHIFAILALLCVSTFMA